MPEALTPDPESKSPATSITFISGGVNLDAQRDVTIGGDVAGRDIIKVTGYTVEQVSTLLTQISSTFQPKPFDGRCPYLGLDAFSEDEADRFFGRETLVSELVARVKELRFVVIAGPSGSGKSSLVRAGLIHTLKQGVLPNSDRWLYATLTPGRDPIESLALAISRTAKSPDAGKYVREHSAVPGALHDFVESQLSDRKDQRAVIFVDQFEEVFTQVSKEDERLAFLNLLTRAATLENGRVTVLFALRSDFVSNCATYPHLNALLNQQFMQVGAMQPDELVSAIARPALQAGLRIDPDLIAQIVNDMQDEPGVLPLMQFALKDLFDAQPAKGGVMALTLNDYLARGGLRKALERHADAAFATLSEGEQQLARTIFSGLIELGRGTPDTRRTVLFDELIPANADRTHVEAVIRKLADAPARLLTTDEQDRRVTVTLAHERLIDAWPWLRRLVNENREAIALQNQIAEDAQEWDEHQQDASYLYSGARLATAREQLAERKIMLSELAQKFVNGSVEAEESVAQHEKARQQQEIQRLRRRNQLILAVGIAAIMLFIVALFFAIQSGQNVTKADLRANEAKTQIRRLIDFLSGRPENAVPITRGMPVTITDDLASEIFVIAYPGNQVGAGYLAPIENLDDLTTWQEVTRNVSLTITSSTQGAQIVARINQSGTPPDHAGRLLVVVPDGTPLIVESVSSSVIVLGKIGSVDASTSNGNIQISENTGTVTARANGSIEVRGSTQGLNLTALGKNHSITVDGAHNQLTLHADNGPIKIVANDVNINASTGSGDILFVGKLLSGASYFTTTSNSNITVMMPRYDTYAIDASTSANTIDVQYPAMADGSSQGNPVCGTFNSSSPYIIQTDDSAQTRGQVTINKGDARLASPARLIGLVAPDYFVFHSTVQNVLLETSPASEFFLETLLNNPITPSTTIIVMSPILRVIELVTQIVADLSASPQEPVQAATIPPEILNSFMETSASSAAIELAVGQIQPTPPSATGDPLMYSAHCPIAPYDRSLPRVKIVAVSNGGPIRIYQNMP